MDFLSRFQGKISHMTKDGMLGFKTQTSNQTQYEKIQDNKTMNTRPIR